MEDSAEGKTKSSPRKRNKSKEKMKKDEGLLNTGAYLNRRLLHLGDREKVTKIQLNLLNN